MKQIIIMPGPTPITIDRCDGCDGYWFDKNELKKVIDDSGTKEALGIEPSPDDEADFKCPRCQGPVETKTLYDINVDLCMDCGGMWLDRGELHEIQTKYRLDSNHEKLIDILNNIVKDE